MLHIKYVAIVSLSKRTLVQNFSYENEFDLYRNGRACEILNTLLIVSH